MSASVRTLAGLFIGLVAGLLWAEAQWPGLPQALAILDPLGTLWLNALKMTVLPLIVALLVVGIVEAAESAHAGSFTRTAVIAFAVIIIASALCGALVTPLLLQVWPVAPEAGRALAAIHPGAPVSGALPTLADLALSFIPTNIVASAAENAILGVIVFTTLFAFAVTRLPKAQHAPRLAVFRGLQGAMQIVIGWVLALAPIGVAALAFGTSARAGTASVVLLLHYIAIVSAVGACLFVAAYGVARLWGGVGLAAFVRACLPAQAVAISTQSSLASLPAMLTSAHRLRLEEDAVAVTLPLAVALFRATGPAMNMAVAIYVAAWVGQPLPWTVLAAGVVAACLTTLGAVSLPGQITFVTSIAPICLAMGVPIAPLAILIAVETLPDIMRTLGNVTMDVAVACGVARKRGDGPVPDIRKSAFGGISDQTLRRVPRA